jgi:hypothetical protein
MRLATITFTGADDHTHPDDLLLLSAVCPFVEWGILLSLKQTGKPKYPSWAWLAELLKRIGPYDMRDHFRFSLHVCGTLARNLLDGGFAVIDAHPALWGMAQRIQINAHGQFHSYNPELLLRLAARHPRKQFILPCDGTEVSALSLLQISAPNIQILRDRSGGRGVLDADWPEPYCSPFGYAGGLTPQNFAGQAVKITEVAGMTPVWVDCESGIRTDGKFDKRKVAAMVNIAHRFTDYKAKNQLCGASQPSST